MRVDNFAMAIGIILYYSGREVTVYTLFPRSTCKESVWTFFFCPEISLSKSLYCMKTSLKKCDLVNLETRKIGSSLS